MSMRHFRRWLPPLAFAIAAFPVAAVAQPATSPIDGLWLNPHHSVAVRTGPCGGRLCGWIVWASAEAKADARDGGVTGLIGTALLENYTPAGSNLWKGTVFVPDMGRRFSSQIDQPAPGTLRVKGCILGGLICKSQLWTRLESVPRD